MAALRLEITDYTGSDRWRWVLKNAEGAYLTDHAVQLDPADPKYQALFNLPLISDTMPAQTSATRMNAV